MVKLLNMPVKLVMCPIEREADGLAMSSRNIHLTADDRQHALILSKTLNNVKANFDGNRIEQLVQNAKAAINAEPGVVLGYFEVADGDTLRPAGKNTKKVVALVAVTVGKTRLIDNVIVRD